MSAKLPIEFYQQDTIEVARLLLGQTLVHKVMGEELRGMIVETEAYLGLEDPACHSFGGLCSPRTQAMYREGGHAYIYFIYGLHFCFNVVTRSTQEPEAVLIRALHPLSGIEKMKTRRPSARGLEDLANGPAKLCQAFGFDRRQNGLSLLGEELYIEQGHSFREEEITETTRIGVDYAGDASEWPLRFYVTDHPSISKRDRVIL